MQGRKQEKFQFSYKIPVCNVTYNMKEEILYFVGYAC